MTDQSMQAIQLEQAVFELRHGVIGNRRLTDRLVVAALSGGAVLAAGPSGVGKCFVAKSVARVFGLTVRLHHGSHDPHMLGPEDVPHTAIFGDIDRAAESRLLEITDQISRGSDRYLVATMAGTDLALLPRRLRDSVMMYVEVPYPDRRTESEMALGVGHATPRVDRILCADDLMRLRTNAHLLPVSDNTLRYAVGLVQATRDPAGAGLDNLAPLISLGASPRASIALVRAARGAALLAGRSEVTIQDVYDVGYDVLLHRVEPSDAARAAGVTARDLVVELLSRVPANARLLVGS